jgi:hypothetical protein
MTRWVVTEKWTVRVTTDERRIITDAAPLVRRFVGQPFTHLVRWAQKQGLVAVEP